MGLKDKYLLLYRRKVGSSKFADRSPLRILPFCCQWPERYQTKIYEEFCSDLNLNCAPAMANRNSGITAYQALAVWVIIRYFFNETRTGLYRHQQHS
jgi:hypothetical protein